MTKSKSVSDWAGLANLHLSSVEDVGWVVDLLKG